MLVVVIAGSVVGSALNWQLIRSVWLGDITLDSELGSETPAGISSVSVQEVKALLDSKKALVVDARREFFYNKERIPNALLLPIVQYDLKFPEFAGRIKKDQLLILYCSGYGCEDSHQLAEKLLQAGYRKLRVFNGGLPEWKQAGLPTEGADVSRP
jgi:rhodanese-related sulfurtransferase